MSTDWQQGGGRSGGAGAYRMGNAVHNRIILARDHNIIIQT